jgi:hypothetical protein
LVLDIPMGQVFNDRQAALKRWGFRCRCDMCTALDEQIVETDARRVRISKLREEVLDALTEKRVRLAIRYTNELIDLLKQEDLPTLLTEPYEILARVYLAANDRVTAERYARLALEIVRHHSFMDPADDEVNLQKLMKSFEE